jgi:hypothetical protein
LSQAHIHDQVHRVGDADTVPVNAQIGGEHGGDGMVLLIIE